MSPAETYYRQQLELASVQTARADRASRRASWLRMLIVAVTIVVLVMRRSSADPELWSIAAVATLMFSGAVWWHRRLRRDAERWRLRGAALEDGLARIERRWHEMVPSRMVPVPAGHPTVIARDLSVLGEHSLMRLLDVTHPALGGQRVCEWLLADPPPVGVIEGRQASVSDLRERPDVLLAAAMIARGRDASISTRALGSFRAWCWQPSPLSRWYVPASWVSVVAVIGLGVSALLQRAAPASWLLWPVLIFHLAIVARARRRLQHTFANVEASLAQLGSTARMMALLVETSATRGRLGAIQQRLAEDHAVRALSALVRLLEWNAIRYSPAAHWALNAAIGFDVHLLAALERWRRVNAQRTVAWLDETADAEALLAFGTLAYEHERWSLPVVSESPSVPLLSARGLTHPLLALGVAVPNDVELSTSGDVVVVSGPNMAGKTTFLRALGLNVLLAQAGSVVAAEHLRVGRCRPRTSVRVEDDLSEGISLFMAEVLRLRDVIHDAERGDGPHVLFLFDEILHGTNAADRRVATRRVLARLQRAGAAGFITTHDPQIVSSNERQSADAGVTSHTAHIHFDGSVSGEPGGALALRFDYRAKFGPSTHTNALAVLEMLGIHAEREDAAGADTHSM